MLVLANRIRPLNEESIMIAENTLEQWQNLKRFHKESDELASLPENHPDHISKEEIFSNVMIEDSRKNFLDSFSAMAAAEYAKEYAIN